MKEGAKLEGAGGAEGERLTLNVERQTLNEERAAAPMVYDLGERLLEYSARVIRLVDSMPNNRAANHVGGQLLRSGTSPQSNHGEAQAAESVEGFIHKLKICKKELIESWRWLRLIQRVPLVRKAEGIEPLIDETDQLIRIFSKSLRTAEARRDNRIQETPEEPDIDPWLISFDSAFNVESPVAASVAEQTRYTLPRRRKARR